LRDQRDAREPPQTAVLAYAHVVPQECEGLRHRGDEGLLLRELQSQLLFEERCHGSLLLFGVLSCPFLLLRARRGTYEEKQVIRVPNGKHDRTPEAPVVVSGLARPALRRRSIAPRGRDSTLQDMPLVSLLDDAESDICKQWREDPALRRASITAEEHALRED